MALCCNQSPCSTHAPKATKVPTTVTTTPPPTCSSFSCPKGWAKNDNADKTVCPGGKCNMAACCNQNPCTTAAPKATKVPTTVTTTPPPTCSSFKCPKGWAPNDNSDKIVCPGGKCNMAVCCNQSPCTTVVATTVTTTPPPPTCASFATCGAIGQIDNAAQTLCSQGKCTIQQCCKKSPCGTVAPAARKYEATETLLEQPNSKKEANA